MGEENETYSAEELIRIMAERGLLEKEFVETMEEGLARIRQGIHNLSFNIRHRKTPLPVF